MSTPSTTYSDYSHKYVKANRLGIAFNYFKSLALTFPSQLTFTLIPVFTPLVGTGNRVIGATSSGQLIASNTTTANLDILTAGANTTLHTHYQSLCVQAVKYDTALSTGDVYFCKIPADVNGWQLYTAHAGIFTTDSGSGSVVKVKKTTIYGSGATTDMATITLDKSKYDSKQGTAPVLSALESVLTVAEGDLITINISTANTSMKGLEVRLQFKK